MSRCCLIIQHPLLVRDALPIAAIPKAPTDGDCLERLPAAIPSPVGWWLRESLVVTFCLHPEKDSGSSAIRAREFSDAKCTCHLPGREGYALCCIAPALPRTEVCLGASLSLRTRRVRLRTPRESRRRCRRRAVRPEIA